VDVHFLILGKCGALGRLENGLFSTRLMQTGVLFMRIDKLTTKFQEALSEAQTLALGQDHAYIDPAHVLLAMLRQEDGPRPLLERAGVNVTGLTLAADSAVKRLPQVTGQDQVQIGPEMVKLLQAAEKESIKRGDAFVAGELFLLALTDSKSELGRVVKERAVAQELGERH
jgi:ATP-dependent Clp protease ATP-binding subunit ClpB